MDIGELTKDAPTMKEVFEKAKSNDIVLRASTLNNEAMSIDQLKNDYAVVEVKSGFVRDHYKMILPYTSGTGYRINTPKLGKGRRPC